MSGPVNAQVRRQTQYNGDRPLKLTTYRDSEIDEKTIQLLKVRQIVENGEIYDNLTSKTIYFLSACQRYVLF